MMKGITLGIILALVGAVLLFNGGASATNVDRCPNQPAVLKTAKGAKKRAHKAWNHRTLKKDKDAIQRVRIQARCVPTVKGRAHVKHHIDEARGDYKKAKYRYKKHQLYKKITAAPGQARLAVLRQCESTNRYNSPAAPAGAYGMLQGWALAQTYYTGKMERFFGPIPSQPYLATPAQQDILASLLYQHHGTSPWECPF